MNVKNLPIKIFLSLITITIAAVFLSMYARYIFAQDYYFLVEAPCDPELQVCFERSCDDYCPPNELEVYKTYQIKANEYKKCSTNTCTNICENSETADTCEELVCNPEADEVCTS